MDLVNFKNKVLDYARENEIFNSFVWSELLDNIDNGKLAEYEGREEELVDTIGFCANYWGIDDFADYFNYEDANDVYDHYDELFNQGYIFLDNNYLIFCNLGI